MGWLEMMGSGADRYQQLSVGLKPSQELPRCNLKLAAVLRGQGETPETGWQMAAVISEGNLHTRSVLGGNKTNSSPHLPAKSYKLIKRPQLGSVTYTTQVFSTAHECLKALSLEQLLGVGKASGTHILRTQGRGERSLIARGQLSGQ